MNSLRKTVSVLVCVVFLVAAPAAFGQDVVAAYGDEVGSIVRYSAIDGSALARIQRVYRIGATTYKPSRIAVEDGFSYYVVLGERFLARLRASDGAILWLVDAGLTVGYTTYFVSDIAVANGNVFLCNYDPGRRIAKFRASDGALLWSVPYGIPDGYTRHLPVKLAATGTDSFFALVGNKYLVRFRQSDGAVLYKISIPVTIYPTTWNFGDLTTSAGSTFVSNVDPAGTVRRFQSSTGGLIWSQPRTLRVGLFWYLPTKLAAAGSDRVMVMFGDRYLARMGLDGRILWSKDISLPIGYTNLYPNDIAAIPAP